MFYFILYWSNCQRTSYSICKWTADFAPFLVMHYNFRKHVSIILFVLIAGKRLDFKFRKLFWNTTLKRKERRESVACRDFNFLSMNVVVHKFVDLATIRKYKQIRNRFQFKRKEVGYVNTTFNLLSLFLALTFSVLNLRLSFKIN